LDINFDSWSHEALSSFLSQLSALHVTHEAVYEGLLRFTGFIGENGLDLIHNNDLDQDFRNVGDAILRAIRRIEDILDIQDRIVRQWT
jgi:hypothetical protein